MQRIDEGPAQTVAVIGATGFIGSEICEHLTQLGHQVRAFSRTGKCPPHLSKQDWASSISWMTLDAFDKQSVIEDIGAVDAIVCCVGSPPLPTFGETAFQQKVKENSLASINCIEAAAENNIQRVIIIGAHIPRLLRRPSFAYFVGKDKARRAAIHQVENNSNSFPYIGILEPSGVFGIRYTKGGTPIPLQWVMLPIALVQKALNRFLPKALSRHLPAPLTNVQDIAKRVQHQLVSDEQLEIVSAQFLSR